MRFVEEHGNPMLVADVNRNANKVHDVPIDPLAPSLDVVVVVPTCPPPTAPLTRSAKASSKCAAATRAMCTQPSTDGTTLADVGRWLRDYAHGMSGP